MRNKNVATHSLESISDDNLNVEYENHEYSSQPWSFGNMNNVSNTNDVKPDDSSNPSKLELSDPNNGPILKALQNSNPVLPVDVLVDLELSVDQRNVYRALLDRSLRRKFILFREHIKEKDKNFIMVLKRECAKISSLRKQIATMTLLQERRENCVDQVFHLAKLYNMSIQELHRLYTASMYYYGSDKYWFEKVIQDSRASSEFHDTESKYNSNDATTFPSRDVDYHPSVADDLPHSHREAEKYLKMLSADPLISRISKEKQRIVDQIKELESISKKRSVPHVLSYIKKDIHNEYQEQLEEIAQQIRASNAILFELLDDNSTEFVTVGSQTVIVDDQQLLVLKEEVLDSFLHLESKKKENVGKQSILELEPELIESRIALKKAISSLENLSEQHQRENQEIDIIEDSFKRKEEHLLQKLGLLDKHHSGISSDSPEYSNYMLEKRQLNLELEKEREQFKSIISRYQRSKQLLEKRIEDMEIYKQLHEAKTKTLEIRLGYYNGHINTTTQINIPPGNAILMYLEIENATALWNQNPDIMKQSCSVYNKLVRKLVSKSRGCEIYTEGDSFLCYWKNPVEAINCALALQLKLLSAKWPSELLALEEAKDVYNGHGKLMFRGLRVRIGVHFGAPLSRINPINGRIECYGKVFERLKRIVALTKGGEISLSKEMWSEIHSNLLKLKYKIWCSDTANVNQLKIVYILPESLSQRQSAMESPIEKERSQALVENRALKEQLEDYQTEMVHLQAIIKEKENEISKQMKEMQTYKTSREEFQQWEIHRRLNNDNIEKLEEHNSTLLNQNQLLEKQLKNLKQQLGKLTTIDMSRKSLQNEISTPSKQLMEHFNPDPTSSDIISFSPISKSTNEGKLTIPEEYQRKVEALQTQIATLQRRCDTYYQKYITILEKYYSAKLGKSNATDETAPRNHLLERTNGEDVRNHTPLTSMKSFNFKSTYSERRKKDFGSLFALPKRHPKTLDRSSTTSHVSKHSPSRSTEMKSTLPALYTDAKNMALT